MASSPVKAALVDVGGTLWPNSWPISEHDVVDHHKAVSRLFPQAGPARLSALIATITTAVEEGTGTALLRDATQAVAEGLKTHGFPADTVTVRGVRKALCVHLGASVTTAPGAADLLAGIKRAGLDCVIVSNTTFRDADVYARDFEALSWAPWIDGCVTSVDAGCRKPDPAIFQIAIRTARVSARHCVMIGDSEEADVRPAITLGMRAIRITDGTTTDSEAHDVVSSLSQALRWPSE